MPSPALPPSAQPTSLRITLSPFAFWKRFVKTVLSGRGEGTKPAFGSAWGAEQALAMPKKKPEPVKTAPPPYEVRTLRRTSACASESQTVGARMRAAAFVAHADA